MVGAGFQEFVSNILCSQGEMADGLAAGDKLVEVENIMSLAYSVLRNKVLPSLLNVEAASSKAFYPHRTFEVGEVAVLDSVENMGTRTDLTLPRSLLILRPISRRCIRRSTCCSTISVWSTRWSLQSIRSSCRGDAAGS